MHIKCNMSNLNILKVPSKKIPPINYNKGVIFVIILNENQLYPCHIAKQYKNNCHTQFVTLKIQSIASK